MSEVMRCIIPVKHILVLWLSAVLLSLAAWAAGEMPDPETYLPGTNEILKQKTSYDDKRDLFETYHPKDVLPPDVWKFVHFDVEEMKKQTAEIIGFTGPELVGKISPEIKPGKYTYKDVDQNPALQELFTPVFLRHVKAGGPPFVCSIMDFEIQPTRQLYWPLPLCVLTGKNLGKTKLDNDGYIVPRSWQGGVPFPRPSGKFRAQQVYYNLERGSGGYDGCNRITSERLAFNKKLKMDGYIKFDRHSIKYMGRAFFPPFGWYDRHAEKRGEFRCTLTEVSEPRLIRGLVQTELQYDDPYELDQRLQYVPMLRRVRKLSPADTEGRTFLPQKITPKQFPYKFEIIDEREFLLPISYNKADTWVDKTDGYAIRNLGLMRRACYVLQMTQLDPNYIYSKRIYYIDKETFSAVCCEFYDQKGRLYRTHIKSVSYFPECGMVISYGTPKWMVDYIDMESNYAILILMPANFDRRAFNIENLIRKGK